MSQTADSPLPLLTDSRATCPKCGAKADADPRSPESDLLAGREVWWDCPECSHFFRAKSEPMSDERQAVRAEVDAIRREQSRLAVRLKLAQAKYRHPASDTFHTGGSEYDVVCNDCGHVKS